MFLQHCAFRKMASRGRALYQNEVDKRPLYQQSWFWKADSELQQLVVELMAASKQLVTKLMWTMICWTFSVESLTKGSKCVPYDSTRLDTIWNEVKW